MEGTIVWDKSSRMERANASQASGGRRAARRRAEDEAAVDWGENRSSPGVCADGTLRASYLDLVLLLATRATPAHALFPSTRPLPPYIDPFLLFFFLVFSFAAPS